MINTNFVLGSCETPHRGWMIDDTVTRRSCALQVNLSKTFHAVQRVLKLLGNSSARVAFTCVKCLLSQLNEGFSVEHWAERVLGSSGGQYQIHVNRSYPKRYNDWPVKAQLIVTTWKPQPGNLFFLKQWKTNKPQQLQTTRWICWERPVCIHDVAGG